MSHELVRPTASPVPREARAALRAVTLGADALLRRLDAGTADPENIATTFAVLRKLLENAERSISPAGDTCEPWTRDEAGDRRCRSCGILWYVGWSSCPTCAQVTR